MPSSNWLIIPTGKYIFFFYFKKLIKKFLDKKYAYSVSVGKLEILYLSK